MTNFTVSKNTIGDEFHGQQMNVNEARPRTDGEDPLGKIVIQGDLVTGVESETQKTISLPPF